MRSSHVLRLLRAELSLGRTAAVVYALAALAGVGLVAAPVAATRGLGASLVMAVLIGQCFHLPIVTVFQDIARGTRLFWLALPVTPAEYAAAKLAANALLFLVPAGAAAAAAMCIPVADRVFPVPLVLLMLLGWLVFFVQNLGIAMVTESQGATIVVLLAEVFLVGNGALNVAPRLPGALRLWGRLEAGGATRNWAFALLALELALLVALILFLMGRKRRFV